MEPRHHALLIYIPQKYIFKKYKIQNIEDSIDVVCKNEAPTSIKDFEFTVLNHQYLNDKFTDQ